MSNYIETRMLGVAAPLVDGKKGDVANRVNCAGAQIKNNAQALVEDVVVIGGTAAGVAVAARGGKFARFINKIGMTVAKSYKNMFKPLANNKTIHKAIQKFKSLPSTSKGAIGTIVALGLAGLSFVGCKQIYKAGQIDQKYTDKAQVRKHQEEVLN